VLCRGWQALCERPAPAERRSPRVAPEEDFFQLGGQSLVAIQIISRIQKVFGVRLPLNAILEAPTVRALAKRVEAESCVLNATT
jgi:acyl carrier protein